MTTLSVTVYQDWTVTLISTLIAMLGVLSVTAILFGAVATIYSLAAFKMPTAERVNRTLIGLIIFVAGWGGGLVARWLQANHH